MRVTASKVGLLAYCQAWARPEMTWDTRSSEAADRGTRFHKAIAVYTERGERVAVEDDIAAEYEHACAWVDALGVGLMTEGKTLLVERSFAWDPTTDTAEMIGGDRDYRRAAGRLCGTVDLVLVVSVAGKPVAAMVWDWKSGSGSEAGPQLRTLGLMVARALNVDDVTVAALEARAAGVFEVAREELDAFALAGVAGDLAEQTAMIATSEPIPGSHCGELYCPARLTCPLGNTAMAEVVEVIPVESLTAPRAFRVTDAITTPEHAAWALDVCRLVGAKLDAIKDQIKALTPADGWPMADGRVLRETRSETRAFDKHKAEALCKQLGATPEQLAALWYTFEKSNGLRVSGGAAKPRTKRSKAA